MTNKPTWLACRAGPTGVCQLAICEAIYATLYNIEFTTVKSLHILLTPVTDVLHTMIHGLDSAIGPCVDVIRQGFNVCLELWSCQVPARVVVNQSCEALRSDHSRPNL